MTQISTETLAATAPAGVTVTEYRGYQLIDNDDYVAICRNAAVVQCAHTPEQAQQNIDELIAEREARKARLPSQKGKGDKTMSKPQTALKTFDDMEAAFRYCRDRNCPVTVIVAGDLWRLYPSGKATPLQRVKDGCA